MTILWKRLQSPFALVVQGFLAGGAVFWATNANAAPLFSALGF